MKSRFLPAVFLIAVILTGNSVALTPIKERFSSGLDPARWHLYQKGTGKLLTKNGKLNYVSLNPTPDDFSSIELLSSRPGYGENWEMIVDVLDTTHLGTKATCGFFVSNSEDRSDYVSVQFFSGVGIVGGVFVDGKSAADGEFMSIRKLSKCSLRVSYNKRKRLMTFYYSTSGKTEGYVWTELAVFSPAGNGGDVRADWNMTAKTGAFVIQLFGNAMSMKVSPGMMTFDNFSLTGKL